MMSRIHKGAHGAGKAGGARAVGSKRSAIPVGVKRTTRVQSQDAPRSYLEVRFEIAESWFDLLSAALQETGCLGLEYRDGSRPGQVKILAYFEVDAPSGSVLERLLPWLRSVDAATDIQCDPVEQQDWNSLWRSTYRPVEISARLVVLPAWSRRSYPGRVVVRIQPEQAFGTGSHETTRLCLEALDSAQLVGRQVADVGTGSGILAIAAARLGAQNVFACDPDPAAMLNARHNLRINKVTDRIELVQGDLSTLPAGRFDVVVANLVLEPFLQGMQALTRSCKPDASLFLSGLLKEQMETLLPIARREGLVLVASREYHDWLLLQFRVPAGPQGFSGAAA